MGAITAGMRETVKSFVSNLDRGFYETCRQRGEDPLRRISYEVQPDESEISRIYTRRLRQWKGEDDGGPFSKSVWDYAERAAGLGVILRERGIHGQQTVKDAFYSDSTDTHLFPAFASASIIQGLLADSLVPRLVALSETTTALSVEKITLNTAARNSRAVRTDEGLDLPEAVFSRAETSVKLNKYGRLVRSTWESRQLQSVAFFEASLARIGQQIGIDMTNDLLETLVSGDGTTGSAVTVTTTDVSGTFDYDDLIRFCQAFSLGYAPSDFIAGDSPSRTLLNMSEFKDPLVAAKFQDRGLNAALPILGALWHRWTETTTGFASDRVIAIDNRRAVKECRWGSVMEGEGDIMSNQSREFTIAFWAGFVKLDNDATKVLDITH